MLYNGRDPANAGWTCIRVGKWLDAPRIVRGSVALPNVAAVVPFGVATAEPRSLDLAFRKYCATLADRSTDLRTLQRLLRGLLYVRTDDWSGRVIRAYVGEFAVTSIPTDVPFANAVVDVATTLTAFDGASYDAEPRVLALSTTPTAVALGERPSVGLIQWHGAWSSSTTRTITVRRPGGEVITTFTITTPASDSLTSSEFLEIDLARRYLTKVSATGVRDPLIYDWKPTSANDWFALDNAYADPANGRDITIELSAGTGILLYRRAYHL